MKLAFQTPLYNNSEYHKFTKIGRFKILFYNKNFLIKIRKENKWHSNMSSIRKDKSPRRIRKNRKKS